MFIVNAHLDLAYNALNNGRDLHLALDDLRQKEGAPKASTGTATVTFPELRRANVGLVFGTLFVLPDRKPFTGLNLLTYHNQAEAHKLGQRQLDYYHRLADESPTFRLVGDNADLAEVIASHDPGQESLLGLLPLMEGADPIREPAEVEMWYERGLRVVGLAWEDTRYSAGAWGGSGGLTQDGFRLLDIMADFGLILDLTHMSEPATLQAMDRYPGEIIASHSNARAMVPGHRQLGDGQIRRLTERDGVIGIVLGNGFLKAGHRRGDPKEAVTLDHIVAHIDYICQYVGDAEHIGIGSDFDGGFGVEDIPSEFNSPADLPLIGQALVERGYTEDDVANIMGGNWLALLKRALP
jgi:membrane dipeptidase